MGGGDWASLAGMGSTGRKGGAILGPDLQAESVRAVAWPRAFTIGDLFSLSPFCKYRSIVYFIFTKVAFCHVAQDVFECLVFQPQVM